MIGNMLGHLRWQDAATDAVAHFIYGRPNIERPRVSGKFQAKPSRANDPQRTRILQPVPDRVRVMACAQSEAPVQPPWRASRQG